MRVEVSGFKPRVGRVVERIVVVESGDGVFRERYAIKKSTFSIGWHKFIFSIGWHIEYRMTHMRSDHHPPRLHSRPTNANLLV